MSEKYVRFGSYNARVWVVWVAIVIVIAGTEGCGTITIHDTTAFAIGCQKADLEVTNIVTNPGRQTWDASCRGTRYRCTNIPTWTLPEARCNRE